MSEDILERLEALWKRRDAEGFYTDGNVAWIAYGEISRLREGIASEREACAKIIEDEMVHSDYYDWGKEIALAIRTRGE